MRKFILIVMSILLLIGCATSNTPTKKVELVFKKYNMLDDAVLNDLELTSESLKLTEESDKANYRKAMEMQFSDLKYEIKDETINGDEAIVTVKVRVYDFFKSQKSSEEFIETNSKKFIVNGVFNAKKATTYKIKELMNTDERVEYTIDINLHKENNEWVVEAFDKDTLEKIHGIYNYER